MERMPNLRLTSTLHQMLILQRTTVVVVEVVAVDFEILHQREIDYSAAVAAAADSVVQRILLH